MRIISFAWTTAAFLENKKTVTRRTWKECYVKPGDIVQAYDRSPRFKGKLIGLIKIKKTSHEPLCEITEKEEKLEGGLWGSAKEYINAFLKGYPGMKPEDPVWRIEFERIKEAEINGK